MYISFFVALKRSQTALRAAPRPEQEQQFLQSQMNKEPAYKAPDNLSRQDIFLPQHLSGRAGKT